MTSVRVCVWEEGGYVERRREREMSFSDQRGTSILRITKCIGIGLLLLLPHSDDDGKGFVLS